MTPINDSRRGTGEESIDANLFCSNAKCELHRQAGTAGVMGTGNWAVLADGRIIGRGIYGTVVLCDVCGRASLARDDS